MDRSLLQAFAGALFMGLGAGFLTYAYGDKLKVRDRGKKQPARHEEYYDPRKTDSNENAKLVKAVSAGFFMGVMFFFYFSNR